MGIRELLKAAQDFKPTEAQIQAANKRYKDWCEKLEKEEREAAAGRQEFLNRTYTL